MSTFADPNQAGDVVKPADVNGHLLLIRPTEQRFGVQTAFGESNPVVVDVADIDANTIGHDVMWFSAALISSLASLIGQTVLARMTQGTAKPGQSPPWILAPESANPDSVKRATDFLAANPGFAGITSPAPAAAGPARSVQPSADSLT